MVFGSDAALRLLPELSAERVPIGADLPAAVAEAAREPRQEAHRRRRQRRPALLRHRPLPVRQARHGPVRGRAARPPHATRLRPHQGDVGGSVPDRPRRPGRSTTCSTRFAPPRRSACSPARRRHPARVARELLARGIDYFRAYVCENLGGQDERITQGELADIREMKFDPLNVLILKRKPNRPDVPRAGAKLRRFGNPDDVFAQRRPKTRPHHAGRGAGHRAGAARPAPRRRGLGRRGRFGSVAIEAAQLVEPGPGYAIEQDSADYHLIVANAETFGVDERAAGLRHRPGGVRGPARPGRDLRRRQRRRGRPPAGGVLTPPCGPAAGWSSTSARWKCSAPPTRC